MWTTIVSLYDIPKALKRQAEMFATSQTENDAAWKKVAEDFVRFADILQEDIVEYKKLRTRKRL